MTEIGGMWNEARPWLHVVADGATGDLESLVPPEGVCFVARLDGGSMVDAQGVFETFSRTFRFPVYFGWNWPALSDCLRDLSWLPARRYLVVIRRSHLMLSQERSDLAAFMRILNHAGEYWSRPFGHGDEWGGQEVAFNVVFLSPEGESAAIENAVNDV